MNNSQSRTTNSNYNSQQNSMLNYIYSPRCMRGSGLIIGILALLFSVILLSVSLTNSLDRSNGSDNIPQYEKNKLPLWALDNIQLDRIKSNTIQLSSDLYQGREPGTVGESLAINMVQTAFNTIGLEPKGDSDGSYIQNVPIYSFALSNTTFSIDSINYYFLANYTLSTETRSSHISISQSKPVFVGFGIDAPQIGWNDYENVNVTGKIVIVFAGTPTSFNNSNQYLGRSSSKYQFARDNGAIGVLFLHFNYSQPWPYIVQPYLIRQITFDQIIPNGLQCKGWISLPLSNILASKMNSSLDAWLSLALSDDFKPFELDSVFDIKFDVDGLAKNSSSVIGGITGKTKPEEVVIMMAHHDHLGTVNIQGKPQIFHGAVDNAVGVSILLEVATALGLYQKVATTPNLAQVGPMTPFDRTILFISVTGEEYGFLGSTYFLENLPPAVANISQIVAMVNFDTANVLNETTDVVSLGLGFSEQLDQVLNVSAADEGMTVSADTTPFDLLYRTDELPFLQAGVPASTLSMGKHFKGLPDTYYLQELSNYLLTIYHTPNDVVIEPKYTFLGTVQQARIASRFIYYLANSDIKPNVTKPVE